MAVRVGIVGRPNVGKSTLFNSIVGKKRALVSNISGVTRDYKEEKVHVNGYNIILIDTAGLSTRVSNNQEKRLNSYTNKVINQLDIILFVFDSREGFTLEDESLFSKFRIYPSDNLLFFAAFTSIFMYLLEGGMSFGSSVM